MKDPLNAVELLEFVTALLNTARIIALDDQMQSDLKVINYERILGTLAQGLHNPTKITAMLENVVKVKNEEEAAALFDEPTPPEKHPKEDTGNVHYIHSKRPEKSS